MQALTIREKLYDYIRVADDKKIKAIYTMLENDVEDTIDWWKDKKFTQALEKEFQDWKSGKVKGSSLAEIEAKIKGEPKAKSKK